MTLSLDESYKKWNKLMDKFLAVNVDFKRLSEESKNVDILGKHVKVMSSLIEDCYKKCLDEMSKYYTDYFAFTRGELNGRCVKKSCKKTVKRK